MYVVNMSNCMRKEKKNNESDCFCDLNKKFDDFGFAKG